MEGAARATWSFVGADGGFVALRGRCSVVGWPVAGGRHGCLCRAKLSIAQSIGRAGSSMNAGSRLSS
eukprot:9101308-Alexandrium_andersonii.AAC.1